MTSIIDEHRGYYGVEPICRVLPISIRLNLTVEQALRSCSTTLGDPRISPRQRRHCHIPAKSSRRWKPYISTWLYRQRNLRAVLLQAKALPSHRHSLRQARPELSCHGETRLSVAVAGLGAAPQERRLQSSGSSRGVRQGRGQRRLGRRRSKEGMAQQLARRGRKNQGMAGR